MQSALGHDEPEATEEAGEVPDRGPVEGLCCTVQVALEERLERAGSASLVEGGRALELFCTGLLQCGDSRGCAIGLGSWLMSAPGDNGCDESWVVRQGFACAWVQAPSAEAAVAIAAKRLGHMGGWKVGHGIDEEVFAAEEYREHAQPGDYTRSVITGAGAR